MSQELDAVQSLDAFLQAVENDRLAATPGERKLAEYIRWYSYNHRNFGAAGVDQRVKFQDEALGGLLHVLYLVIDDLRQMKGQGGAQHGLIVPHWMGTRSVPVRVRLAS
jgi:hypothetical protein